MSSKPDFAVKRLTSGQSPDLVALNAVFAEAFGDGHVHEGRRPDSAYLERLLSRDQIIALVATEGSDIVGGLVAYELDKFEQARSEIYIYDLAVREDWRRRGVATALIERLREIGSERGAWMIFVQADHGDDAAIALYDSLGIREDVLHFDISVAAPSG